MIDNNLSVHSGEAASLSAEGLVERSPHPSDRRVNRLTGMMLDKLGTMTAGGPTGAELRIDEMPKRD